MDQVGVTSTSNGNTNNAHCFETDTTETLGCRDEIIKWSMMIWNFSKVDNKFKYILRTIRIIIYMRFEQPAQEYLTRASRNGSLNKGGDEKDEKRNKGIEKILDIAAEDLKAGRVDREVQLIENLGCERKHRRNFLNDSIIRFNTEVSLYTNKVGIFSPQKTLQYL